MRGDAKDGLGLPWWAVPRGDPGWLVGVPTTSRLVDVPRESCSPSGRVGTDSRPEKGLQLQEELCPPRPSAGGPRGPGQSGRGEGGQGPSLLFSPSLPSGVWGPQCRAARITVFRGSGEAGCYPESASTSWRWLGELVPGAHVVPSDAGAAGGLRVLREAQKLLEKTGLGLAPSSRCSLLGRAPRHQSGLLGWAGTGLRSVSLGGEDHCWHGVLGQCWVTELVGVRRAVGVCTGGRRRELAKTSEP